MTRRWRRSTSGGADIRGLSGRVPSLNIESSFGRTFPRFYIRGLGNTDFDLNASQPVSLVYDDVVLENPILKGFPAFDVDRIEVLRGPQGTLFGRNTPAGIVKFDTVKPGKRPQLCAHQLRHLLARSTPKARSAARSATSSRSACRACWQHRNDWIDNLDEPGDNDLEGYDDIALRGPDAVEADRRADAAPDRPVSATSTATPASSAPMPSRPGSNKLVGVDGGDFERDEVRADGLNFQELTTWNVAGTIEYDFGPVTLYSVTSYWHGKLEEPRRHRRRLRLRLLRPRLFDNSEPGFIPFPAQSQDNIPSLDQFTQEIRIASNNVGGLGYQAGIFYFDENLDIESVRLPQPDRDDAQCRSSMQRQDSQGARHLRLGQLSVRQWA